jgi:deferrochelatase/peroxidase EfeB
VRWAEGSVRSPSFDAAYLAGVLDGPAAASSLLAMDLLGSEANEVSDVLRTLTDRARLLVAGGSPAEVANTAGPAEDGILGPRVPPGEVTITVGLGASLFDGRFGLADKAPSGLRPMAAFPGDQLDPGRTHGDLSVLIRSDHVDGLVHSIRDLTRHLHGSVRLRWTLDGASAPPRPSGAPRNYLGFKDGISNPDPTKTELARKLLWVQPGDGAPQWTVGGTFQVVRLIRISVEDWDQVPLRDQEYTIGRRRDSGAPLDGSNQDDRPDYARDPFGVVTPMTAHIRLANPRTPETAGSQILRRSFNYSSGVDQQGRLDQGLVFLCYQRDIGRQFEVVQTRLFDEPLARYTTAVGGGYFFVPPATEGPDDFLASGLFR